MSVIGGGDQLLQRQAGIPTSQVHLLSEVRQSLTGLYESFRGAKKRRGGISTFNKGVIPQV